MDKAGVKDTDLRYLTGQAQVSQDASYIRPQEEDLLSEYLKAIPLLTIDPTQRLEKKNQLDCTTTRIRGAESPVTTTEREAFRRVRRHTTDA